MPVRTCPKLRLLRSRLIESSGWTSTSTCAPCDALPLGGGLPPHVVVAAAELRGCGASASKSAALSPVSVQPAAARVAAVVLVSDAAAPEPS